MLKMLWFLLVIVNSLVVGQVCDENTGKKCDCKQFTDEITHLPVTLADCSALKISTIPDMVESVVRDLDMSFNNIEVLDSKQQLISKDLKKLVFSYNKIYKIDEEFFQNIPNLEELDLSHNYITMLRDGNIFENLKKLTKVDLSFNSIKSLPDGVFDGLTNLRSLDLSYNAMGSFLASAEDVFSNELKVNENLTHLSLSGLNITEFHNAYFDSFKTMKYLCLADNGFANVPVIPYSVEYLDLSGNNFTFISARYLNYHSIKVLKLNRMPSLTDIHHYAFYNLYALEQLSITDCPNLRVFSDLAFDVASKNNNLNPKSISLARNGLEKLNETYKYFFKNMDYVDLSDNPWECDCSILWLQEFEEILHKPDYVKCFLPRGLKYKNILHLQKTDLEECYPEIYGKKSHRVLIAVLMSSVVVLCGVIFYLIRYPSSWLGTRQVGPNSPYNLASTSDRI